MIRSSELCLLMEQIIGWLHANRPFSVNYLICLVCVRVCVCARACARARVCACVCLMERNGALKKRGNTREEMKEAAFA